MVVAKILAISALLLIVAACSGEKVREGVFRGIYDGARLENMRGNGNTPADMAGRPDPDYDRYSGDRRQVIERDTRQ